MLIGVAGFEPTMAESKSAVLPLDDTPVKAREGNRTLIPSLEGWYTEPLYDTRKLSIFYILWRGGWSSVVVVVVTAKRLFKRFNTKDESNIFGTSYRDAV